MPEKIRKFVVRFKEYGSNEIHETSYTGPVDREDVIIWFGLDDADVTWYEVKEVDNPNN